MQHALLHGKSTALSCLRLQQAHPHARRRFICPSHHDTALSPLPSLMHACSEQNEALAADTSNSHDGQGGLPNRQWIGADGRWKEGWVAAPLTLLPQDKGDESPACLDGSPYGFYFSPSKTGSKRWTVSISGGGWCYDECAVREHLCASGNQQPWPRSAVAPSLWPPVI